MPGVDGPSHLRANAIGLRGDEPPAGDVVRVLCIGGSTTECLYLDQPETWPALLQARLSAARPTWVANAGRSGHSTREHVVQVEELLACDMHFDVVVLLAGVNDLGKRLARDRDYDAHYLERPGARDELLRTSFALGPPGPWDTRPAYKRTALWTLASRWRGAWFGDPRAQDPAGEIYVHWRELRAAASSTRDALPELSSALGEFDGNLARCADACERFGAELVLVDQACMWRSDLPDELCALLWMGGVGEYQTRSGSEYYSVGALAAGMAAYNRAMAEFARARGLLLVQLDAALPKDTRAFYDDVHLNEAGARAAADVIGAALLARPPFAALGK
jgi:lysophospholipase L1-like esterase